MSTEPRRFIHQLITLIALAVWALPSVRAATNQDIDFLDSLRNASILFVGAHPDDEWVLMPILADACLFNGASCHFVSTTEAEMGCLGTMGWVEMERCAEHRERELAASASLVHGSFEILGWQDLFYAHDADGLRRNLAKWAELHGGRKALVEMLANVISRRQPDIVFALDPRHGSTCNPNHRATSLLLIEAIESLPLEDRPRTLFENTYSVFERMSETQIETVELGGMLPWPKRHDRNFFYDGTRVLPNGRRAIDYQIDALRAHRTQFPDLPDDVSITADSKHLGIPLVDLAEIDPAEELCAPLDLSEYLTIDVTLAYVGRKFEQLAEAGKESVALRLTHNEVVVSEYGDPGAYKYREEFADESKGVELLVAADTPEKIDAAKRRYLPYVMRFVGAPD